MAGGYWAQGRMCQQSKHHTREQKYDTQPAPSHPDPILNTLLSISVCTHTHTLNCCYISFARSLTLSRCLSPSLPRSVHLFHSLFPHVYLRLPAYSHMALLTQLCHTHPTCCVSPRSDRCCSLGCASCVSHLSDNFLFWLITPPPPLGIWSHRGLLKMRAYGPARELGGTRRASPWWWRSWWCQLQMTPALTATLAHSHALLLLFFYSRASSLSHVCLCYVRTLPHHLTFWCQLHVHLEHGRLAADSDASAVLE